MERRPIWEDKSPELKQQEIDTCRLASIGGKAIELVEVATYLSSDETLAIQETSKDALLCKLLEDNPDWVISLDGKWIYSPIERRANYLGE